MKHLLLESAMDEDLSSRMSEERAREMADNLEAKGFMARVVPCTAEEALVCDCRIEDYS